MSLRRISSSICSKVLVLTRDERFKSRIFTYSQAFYSIFQHRRQRIVFGERPEDLAEAGTIDQRIWEKHQTHLRRLLELVRLGEEQLPFARFREMLEEIQAECPV